MKLSIITINYNNAEGLKKTINSVVNQRNENFEYIIIDGNSTDESIAVINSLGQHITHWSSEPDTGIYNAMNKGLHMAKGEYVLFLNSGDQLKENADLNSLINNLTGEDLIYFNLEISNPKNNKSFEKTYPDTPDFKYFAEDTLPHTGSFIKRQLLVQYGGYSEKMKIVSDWAFFMDAVCLYNCTYKHINNSFSIFYLDGISSDKNNQDLLMEERNNHISQSYKLYNSLYKDWIENKQKLYKLKRSSSIKVLKKIGFLKWLSI